MLHTVLRAPRCSPFLLRQLPLVRFKSGPAGQVDRSQAQAAYIQELGKGRAADYFVGLSKEAPATQEEADKQAQEWLESIHKVRKELRPENKHYYASKVLRPEGAPEDWSFLDHTEKSEKYPYTAEQKAKWSELTEDFEVPERDNDLMVYLSKVIMRHGRYQFAYKSLNQALYLVFLQTRKNPQVLLRQILEDMAPLLRIQSKATSGAQSVMLPMPLKPKQGIRLAWDWILEAANRRQSRDFSVRLAEEIVAASKGNSPGFEKRAQLHKMAITNRGNVELRFRKPMRGKR